MNSKPRHFPFVDSLRGFAILGVIAVHCGSETPHLVARLMLLVNHGADGVQLFFVISAFTLFWSLRSRELTEIKPMRAFYVRRFFRIAPLFWTGIIFYRLWPVRMSSGFAPNGIGWSQVLATVFFVHGWYPTSINSVVPGGWSIAAEAMFYLVIPLLFKRVRTLTGALWLALLSMMFTASTSLIAARLLCRCFPASWNNLIWEFVAYSFPSQFPVFCLGIVLYFMLAGDEVELNSHSRADSARRAMILLITTIYLLANWLPWQVLAAGAFVSISYALAVAPFQILVNPITQFIGKVSFSAYLWHFAIVEFLVVHDCPAPGVRNDTVRFAILFPIAVVVTLAVSTASYYVIELPGINAGREVIRRLGWGRPARPAVALSPDTAALQS